MGSGYVSFHHKANILALTLTALIQRRAESRTEAKPTPPHGPHSSPERSCVSCGASRPGRGLLFRAQLISPLGF